MDDKFASVTAQPIDASNEGRISKSVHIRTIGGGAAKYGPMDQLDRYLSSKPILSFGLTLQASWEAVAISFQSTLLNGGPSTLVYGCILSVFGSASMAASLGEMASVRSPSNTAFYGIRNTY